MWNLADLINSLEEAQATGRLTQRFKVLTHPAPIVVDEIGYSLIGRTGAMLFFQLMARRFGRASTMVTSNKGSRTWGEIASVTTNPAAARRRRSDEATTP